MDIRFHIKVCRCFTTEDGYFGATSLANQYYRKVSSVFTAYSVIDYCGVMVNNLNSEINTTES